MAVDIKYYAEKYLPNPEYFLNRFKNYDFESMYNLINYLDNLTIDKLKSTTNPRIKQLIFVSAQSLCKSLKDNEVLEQDVIDSTINNAITKFGIEKFMSQFDPKKHQNYISCKCPKCGKNKGRLFQQGETWFILCHRENNCVYGSKPVIAAYLTDGNNSYKSMLDELDVNLEEHIVHKGMSPVKERTPTTKKEMCVPTEAPIEYLEFDRNREFKSVKIISDFYDKLDKMTKHQVLNVIYETIFRIIKRDKNKSGEKRRKPMWSYLLGKRGFDSNSKYFDKIGFLHLKEAAPLFDMLLNTFSIEQLAYTSILRPHEEDDFIRFAKKEYSTEIIQYLLDNGVTSQELIDDGIITPLDSKQPLQFVFKKEFKLLQKLNDVNPKKVRDFLFTFDEDNNLFELSFAFLFNEWNEKSGLVFLKCENLYSGLTEEFRIRPTVIKKGLEKFKEVQLGASSIVKALPFGLDYETLKNAKVLYASEGPMDLISLGNSFGETEIYGFGVPGTHRIVKEQLGLLRGKTVVLILDQDRAGKKAAIKFKKFLQDAGVHVLIASWCPSLAYTNSNYLSYLRNLKNHLVVSKKFNFTAGNFMDLNEVKIAIKKDEDKKLPFASMHEFFNLYVKLS